MREETLLEIVGFKEWLILTLRFREIRDWFLQIWFCHHNARVLADMEYRLGCVLSETTRGMSKAYYTWEVMQSEIQAYQSEQYDEAYTEGVNDAAESARAVTAARHGEKSEDWQEGFDRGGNAAADAVLEIIHPQQPCAAV